MPGLADKVCEIIARELSVNVEQVSLRSSFMDDLGADSLDTVELVMAFEEEFDIDIPDADAEKIRIVQDAIEYLTKATGGGEDATPV